MKNSLKQKIVDWLKKDGQVSYKQIEVACEDGSFGRWYKLSNCERRLRELTDNRHQSYNPDIEKIEKNGAIIAYRHKNPVRFVERRVLDEFGNCEKIIRLPI